MDERKDELDRIEKELLAQEDRPTLRGISVDDILADEELNAILNEDRKPAFENPEQIHAPAGEMAYNNYANDYGKQHEQKKVNAAAVQRKNEKIQISLMITACVLCLGIIGVLIYWLNMLS